MTLFWHSFETPSNNQHFWWLDIQSFSLHGNKPTSSRMTRTRLIMTAFFFQWMIKISILIILQTQAKGIANVGDGWKGVKGLQSCLMDSSVQHKPNLNGKAWNSGLGNEMLNYVLKRLGKKRMHSLLPSFLPSFPHWDHIHIYRSWNT